MRQDQDYYLQYIGVERWFSRQPAPSLQFGSYFFILGSVEKPLGTILFDSEEKHAEEENLVTAIVKALQLPYHGGYYQKLSCQELDSSIPVVILMGVRVAEFFLKRPVDVSQERGKKIIYGTQACFVSYAASQLLNNKPLKAQAWQDLQLAKLAMP